MNTTNVYALVKVRTTAANLKGWTQQMYVLVKVRTIAAKSAMAQNEAKKMIITFFSCCGYMKGRKIRQNLSHESSPTVNKRAKTPKVLMKADTWHPQKPNSQPHREILQLHLFINHAVSI